MAAKTPIYLDYNATAPVLPAAIETMREMLALPMNPSSVHGFGRKARQRVEEVRALLAERISCAATDITFMGSGTEANNTLLAHFRGKTMLVSAIEHMSVLKAAEGAERIPVDAEGVIDLGALEARLAEGGVALVSVMLANNETGVIQPVAEAAALAHAHSALLHCDAVQMLGKGPLDLGMLQADYVTLAAHKMGGPVGAAALVVRQGSPMPRLLSGGGQERGRRAGTENVAALVGWGEALRHVPLLARNEPWHRALERRLLAEAPGLHVLGQGAPRLPNCSSLRMPGVKAETQLMHFDLDGLAVSAGSACSSGRIEASHVALAMGVAGPDEFIRVSSGWDSRESDFERFAESWIALWHRLAGRPETRRKQAYSKS